jgi:anaerobic magnesium-protoporphyrin IX monomethyl ester cyclase
MTRVLLVNPPSPERLGAPLLGQQYVAAALLARGFTVKVVDAAARYWSGGEETVLREAEAFSPDVVGFGLFTRWIGHAYALAERFAGRFPLLVAGGAHATARPEETLAHGFDAAVVGEAEETAVALVDALERGAPLEEIPGVVCRGADGAVRRGPPGRFVADLDALAPPLTAQHLFDPRGYDPEGRETVPGGLLTSRGCPARCTFCANYVTGRRFRARTPHLVADELNALHVRTGATFYPFWDDALTADRQRLLALCDAFEARVDFPLSWSAITRASLVTPALLSAMKRAGCVAVNFGVESGDDEILLAIRKGVTTDQVVRALEAAKDAGLLTTCNFMLGFPQDTVASLSRTLAFMEGIAPLVDSFSTLGVVVPFPATPLYEEFHERFGFTDWWLREDYSRFAGMPPVEERELFARAYLDDANLDLDFFRYDESVRALVCACLEFKGRHNLSRMGLFRDPVFQMESPSAPPAT